MHSINTEQKQRQVVPIRHDNDDNENDDIDIAGKFVISEDLEELQNNIFFLIKEFNEKELDIDYWQISLNLIPLLNPQKSNSAELSDYVCILFALLIKTSNICNYYVKYNIHLELWNYLPNTMAFSLFQQLLIYNKKPKESMIKESADYYRDIYNNVFDFLSANGFIEKLLEILNNEDMNSKDFLAHLMCFATYSNYDQNHPQILAYLAKLLGIFVDNSASDQIRFILFSVFNNFVQASTNFVNYFLKNAAFISTVKSFDVGNIQLCREFIRFLSVCVMEKEDFPKDLAGIIIELMIPYIRSNDINYIPSIANFFHECSYSIPNISNYAFNEGIVEILYNIYCSDIEYKLKAHALRAIASLVSVSDEECIVRFLNIGILDIILDNLEAMWNVCGQELTESLSQIADYAKDHDESLLPQIFDSDAFYFVRDIYDQIYDKAACRPNSIEISIIELVSMDPNYDDFE